jgi:capsular exopolysaccharide synthesis family protein
MPEQSARSEAWQQIDGELKGATREYDRLSATLLPGHEKMRELRKRLDFLTYSMDLEWRKAITALQLEKSHLTQRLEDLQKQMPEYRKLVNGYDSYKREFRLQNSGRLAWESAYVGMKARLTAMEYTGEEVRVELKIAGFNEVQDEIPVSPNKKKLLNYALAFSLGLGLGGPILIERLRFTSSFITEAEKYCQLTPCGVVPYLSLKELSMSIESGNEVRSMSHGRCHLVESFRMIRTTIPLIAQPDNRNQVLMITSSRPADGKSTVAAHLAKSFADAGVNTLLIDADIRRGTLHRIFNLSGKSKGMLECLTLDVPVTELIQVTDHEHLKLLPRGCGPTLDIDRELLSGVKFRDLIEGLRGSYDKIIIDSPPLLGLADSILISGSVDGILFVIRSDQTTQRDIVSAAELLHRAKAPTYGFVLNAVDFQRAENYYYYGYYHSQYYESTYYQSEPARLN